MYSIDQMVEVKLNSPEDFLKIKETLSRIGLASKKDNTLYQSCHILHKQGKYYIVHFKELFLLDGKQADFTDNDVARRNRIVCLLEEWELLDIINYDIVENLQCPLNQIKIIPHKDKHNWNLVTKYTIGNRQ